MRQESSLFLNKLNDPAKQPKNVRLYTIAGTGCDTHGLDGDGIVLRDHVPIPGAQTFIVNGTCSTTTYLHTKMLDIDLYPETYEIIKSILKS